jgi:hypothetical protein
VLLLQGIAGRVEALGIPRHENKVPALGRQGLRERGAEARARTGDEGGTQRNTPKARPGSAIIGREICRGYGPFHRS